MDLNQELETGQKAERDFKIVEPRLELMLADLREKWESTSAAQTDEREAIYRQIFAIKNLIKLFRHDIDTGKLAAKQLEAENVNTRRKNRKSP